MGPGLIILDKPVLAEGLQCFVYCTYYSLATNGMFSLASSFEFDGAY